MTISRRPNRCASSEKAPGPRHTIATVMTIDKPAVSLDSNRLRLRAGDQKRVLAAIITPARAPATGVRYPIKSDVPLAISNRHTKYAANLRSCESAKHAVASARSVIPSAARKSRSPTPGQPPLKMENIRCRIGSLVLLAVLKQRGTKRNPPHRGAHPQGSASFDNTFGS